MLRPMDNVYRQGVNMVVSKGGASFWYNVDEYNCIPLTEKFVEAAIEEKLYREELYREVLNGAT